MLKHFELKTSITKLTVKQTPYNFVRYVKASILKIIFEIQFDFFFNKKKKK